MERLREALPPCPIPSSVFSKMLRGQGSNTARELNPFCFHLNLQDATRQIHQPPRGNHAKAPRSQARGLCLLTSFSLRLLLQPQACHGLKAPGGRLEPRRFACGYPGRAGLASCGVLQPTRAGTLPQAAGRWCPPHPHAPGNPAAPALRLLPNPSVGATATHPSQNRAEHVSSGTPQ